MLLMPLMRMTPPFWMPARSLDGCPRPLDACPIPGWLLADMDSDGVGQRLTGATATPTRESALP